MAEALKARDKTASRLEVEVGRNRKLAAELEGAETGGSRLQQRTLRLSGSNVVMQVYDAPAHNAGLTQQRAC